MALISGSWQPVAHSSRTPKPFDSPGLLFAAVDLVVVDVAQGNQILHRVFSPIFVMLPVVKFQHLAGVVG